jgi:hypothetical protein
MTNTVALQSKCRDFQDSPNAVNWNPQRLGQGGLDLPEVLQQLSPLPNAVILVGVAADGLPVLLNLRDPASGPLLLAGDTGAGKTRLLQMMARAIELVHNTADVRYAVLTERTAEWTQFAGSPHCEGILAAGHALAQDYLAGLAETIRRRRSQSHFLVLMLDTVEVLERGANSREFGQILLASCPAIGIWPLATVNTSAGIYSTPVLEAFRTRLCGRIASLESAETAVGSSDWIFRTLEAGSQFAMRTSQGWLPFWIPRVD